MSAAKPGRLFHLTPTGELPVHEARDVSKSPGIWRPASLASEGFVHLSFAHQLRGTLDVHFTETDPPLMLLELDAETLGGDLRLEPSRGGEEFPHLFRGIRRADLLRSWQLEHRDGRWSLPVLAPRPSGDDPPGVDARARDRRGFRI